MRNRNSRRRTRLDNYADRTNRERNLYESNTRRYRGQDFYDTNAREYSGNSGNDHYDNVAGRDNYSVGRWSSGSERPTRRRSRRRDNRNIFEKAGNSIRNTWNRWTDNDENRRYNDHAYGNSYEQYETDYDTGRHYNVNDESPEYGWYGERNHRLANQNPTFSNRYRDRGTYHNDEYDYSTERNRDQYLDDSVNNSEGNHPSRYYDDHYIEHNMDMARGSVRGRRMRQRKKSYTR